MIDFSKCLYNPNDRNLEQKMMKDMESFNVDLGIDVRFRKSTFAFIIMMYDDESPLREIYPDITARRMNAAFQAGFKMNPKNEFPEKVEKIILGEDDRIIPMITEYLLRLGIPDILALVATQKMFEVVAMRMMSGKAQKEDMEQHRKLLSDIKKLEEDIFRGKESVNIRRALYKGVDSFKKAPRPEEMAKRLRDNPNDKYEEGNPYSTTFEGYSVEKLRFINDEHPVS
jgi:hypothetical protein